jgi:prevent-host-death family protein
MVTLEAAMGKLIGAAEFKAHCLRILDEVERSGESVTVTKRGRPVAELKPVAKKGASPSFGALKSGGYRFEDPFSPAYDGPWDAEKGRWEPEE